MSPFNPITFAHVRKLLASARRLERDAEGYRILEHRGQIQRGVADAFVAKAAELRKEAAALA